VGGSAVVPVGGAAVVLVTRSTVVPVDGCVVPVGALVAARSVVETEVDGTATEIVPVVVARAAEPCAGAGRAVVAVVAVGLVVVVIAGLLVVVFWRRGSVVTTLGTVTGRLVKFDNDVVVVARAGGAGLRASLSACGRRAGGGVCAVAWVASTPPAVTAIAPTATCAPVKTECPTAPRRAANGTSATHESGPIVQRRRPMDTLRKALTIAGSNWVPAQRVSSVRAATGLIAFL
jgi:hypothetical protein